MWHQPPFYLGTHTVHLPSWPLLQLNSAQRLRTGFEAAEGHLQAAPWRREGRSPRPWLTAWLTGNSHSLRPGLLVCGHPPDCVGPLSTLCGR